MKLTGKAKLNLCDCSADKRGKINGEKKEGIPRHTGIYINDAEFNMYGGQITGNTGCYMTGPNNSSLICGGGLYVESGKVHLYGGSITENTASDCGAGIYAVSNSEIVMHSENAKIFNNQSVQTNNGSSSGAGGGIYLEGSSLSLEQGIISENEAGCDGGGIYAKDSSTIQIEGGTILNNKAQQGGGILLMGGGTFLMSSGEICGNASALSAGGVYIDDSSSSFTMTGGIISEGGSFAMKGGEISGNICGAKGGGIYVTGTFVLYDSSVIKDNKDKYTNSTNVLLWTNCKITIGGVLGDTISKNPVRVSIYNSGTGIFTEGWTNKMSGQNVEEFFVAEQPDYQVSLKDGEGFIDFPGYSLTYVIPENEGISGTVPETARYPRNTRIDMDESKNTLTKKGYTHIGWKWQERERIPVTYVLMSMSKELYPVFSRNFTAEDTRIESKAGEVVAPLDLNKLVNFDEGVTETEKNFQFEIDETSQLPKGLMLENGMISGTPEKAGETGVTIKVQDKAVNGQSRTFVLAFAVEMGDKQSGTASVTQKDLHCGEPVEPVPVSGTNGTEHVTYYYKAVAAADTEYTTVAPTAAGSYIVRAVFAETDVYKEVTAGARFTISHKYGETWETDKSSHWHGCVCGAKKDTEAHMEDAGTVTKKPSAKEPGERTFKCGVCGRVLRTEEIPALNTGNLEKEIQIGDGVPDIRVPAPPEELADIVLTQEEQESVEKGTDIKIILTVTDAENLVGNAEKEIVQKALDGYEKGQYLDISLFKQIDGVRNKIVKVKGNIRIVLEIPEQLKKENADNRAFAVIRVHDGKAVWLEDLDNDKNTITIETDCFSTYVLAYRDGDKTDDNKPDDNKPDDNKPDDNKGDKEKLDGNTADTDGKAASPEPDGGNAGRGKNEASAAEPKNGAAKNDNSVKTGDSAKTGFWLAVFILSGAACPLLYSGIRKRREKKI